MMMRSRRPKNNMFAVRCQSDAPPEPSKNVVIVEADEYDDDYDDEPVRMIKPKRTKKKALPGERLLRQIARDRIRDRMAEQFAALAID